MCVGCVWGVCVCFVGLFDSGARQVTVEKLEAALNGTRNNLSLSILCLPSIIYTPCFHFGTRSNAHAPTHTHTHTLKLSL